MRGLLIFMLLIVLVLSFLPFRSSFAINNIQNPSSDSFLSENKSPGNRVSENEIEIQHDRVIIHINNSELSRFGNTTSMLPLISRNANGIVIKPANESQIKTGDIIAFSQDGILIVHRVIEIGKDEEGWYAFTKGDNAEQDDGKIRFNQVRYVTIALIY